MQSPRDGASARRHARMRRWARFVAGRVPWARRAKAERVLRQSGLFDPAFYLEANPEVARAGLDPLRHFLARGAREGRDPSAAFDVRFYLTANPDVARCGMNPLLHYVLHGRGEGRSARRRQERPTRAFRGGRAPRLGILLLVRDEADLIAENIRFHVAHGVDFMVVTDNGSVDGTREILGSLSSEFDLEIIDEPSRTFEQVRWTNRMVHRARESGKVDWVILGDADEFWWCPSGDLKDVIPTDAAGLRVPRFNMLPRAADVRRDSYRFFDNVMCVRRPLPATDPQPDPSVPLPSPLMLRAMPPKVMCRLEGIRTTIAGNHEIEHDAGPLPSRGGAMVFHFPLRTLERFVLRVENHGRFLAARPKGSPGDSWHVRRLYALHRQGRLEETYWDLVLDDERAAELQEDGVIVPDETIRHFFLDERYRDPARRSPDLVATSIDVAERS